jgi:hypothetical protein
MYIYAVQQMSGWGRREGKKRTFNRKNSRTTTNRKRAVISRTANKRK